MRSTPAVNQTRDAGSVTYAWFHKVTSRIFNICKAGLKSPESINLFNDIVPSLHLTEFIDYVELQKLRNHWYDEQE